MKKCIGINKKDNVAVALLPINKGEIVEIEDLKIKLKEDIKKGEPKVKVKCRDFGESGILLRATVFSEESLVGFNMLSDLRFSIKKRFDAEGIEIPYPHRTLIIKQNKDGEAL